MSKVSVILPVYNRAATLERCVQSVLAQTFADFELIAVDDCSGDKSLEVLARIDDPRLRVLRHERNRGPSAARNTAIGQARGELLALIDSDDEWLPGKLAAQIALLEKSGCGLCGCEYFALENGSRRHVSLPQISDWELYLHTRCDLGNGTTLLVRRSVVEKTGLLDETMRLYEDWDWVLRMLGHSTLSVVHEPLAIVHVGPGRSAPLVARSAKQFLGRHDDRFARRGARHRQNVRAQHYQFVAANAFEARHFRLGCRFLLKSFTIKPVQNPLRLAALLLAPVDALLGTSLIALGAKFQRRLH